MKQPIIRAQKYLNQNPPATRKALKVLNPLKRRKNAPWVLHHLLGIALLQEGDHQNAAKQLQKALKKGSEEPETHHLLSVSYYHQGKFNEAEQAGREAVGRRDDFFKAWLNLGAVYRAQARLDEALQCYQKANQLDPRSAAVAFRIGAIYRDQGDLKKAMELFNITLKIDSTYVQALLEKADIFKKQRKFEEAGQTLQLALEDIEEELPVKVALAELNKEQGLYEEAISLYKDLLNRYPKAAGVRINYALCLQELGQFDESEKNYRQALDDQPESHEAFSNYLMGLHYNPERTKEEIYEAHLRWDELMAPAKRPERPIPENQDKNKKLRIGFLSGGFRRHPVGWMITEALENLPKDQFKIYCYTSNNQFDPITQRIHQSCAVWRSVVGYTDEVTAQMIREDKLDILVELSGHAGDSRLKAVDLNPAPVIVKWVGGLFNTTGMQSIDFLITDNQETPVGEEKYYTEKLVRMPDDYISFLPPDYAPGVGPLPAQQKGYITFGCFNNPTKVNDRLLAKWARILNRVPESRLFLKSKQYDTPSLTRRIVHQMVQHGIEEDRLLFKGQTLHEEHLEAYNQVDIALDCWPYSGGLTTCEALWMGVPVITKTGPTFAGRHSATHLMNAGFPDWVTDHWEDYINSAVDLAQDQPRLQELRSSLRQELAASPVCDGERFAGHLSEAFREMWNQRVAGYEQGNEKWQDHIEVQTIGEKEAKETTSVNTETVFDSSFITDEVEGSSNGVGNLPDDSKRMINRSNGQSKIKSGEKEQEVYKIETNDEVTVCTPADLNMVTPYVLLEQGEWFEPELQFVRDYLKPGMNAIDVGAGFGAYALPMAKQVGDQGKVYAFEPGSVARKHLEMSKLENHFSQLEVLGRGVGEQVGKAYLETLDTPEQNQITFHKDQNNKRESEEILQTTLNDWWEYEGHPKIELVKIDVNGREPDILSGGTEVFKSTKPVLLISITEESNILPGLQKQLKKAGYDLYEYIPGPQLLVAHDLEAGTDAYMVNIIAVHKDKAEEIKQAGWIYEESVPTEAPEPGEWKKALAGQPWARHMLEKWETKAASHKNKEYVQALNLICSAEGIKPGGASWRSGKGVMLLKAAQKLIALFNNGQGDLPSAITYVRVMNQLGKRQEALGMAKELMEYINSGVEMEADLPFLPFLNEQETTEIHTGFSNWLTVRIVEGWIKLQSCSSYHSEKREKEMLLLLKDNPEASNSIKKINELVTLRKKMKGKKEVIKEQFHVLRDGLKTEAIADKREPSKNSTQSGTGPWMQSMLNLITVNGPRRVKRHRLSEKLVVTLTSYPDRFHNLPLTLASLCLQSVKPDHIVLWIAREDKEQLTPEIKAFKSSGVEIRFCEDLKSYKKVIPALKAFPGAFLVTADDDLYYRNDWLEGLVAQWDGDEKHVVAHRAHRIRYEEDGTLAPYKNWGWEYREETDASELNFPTSGMGALYPPGVFSSDVTDSNLFLKLAPTADDIWLYWMARLNGAEFSITPYKHPMVEWPGMNQTALWKTNILDGANDRQIRNMMRVYSFPDKQKCVSKSPSIDKAEEHIVTVFGQGRGYKMYLPNRKSDHIQKIIAQTQRPYEQAMLQDMLQKVEEGDLFLDIGANIGNHTLFMSLLGKCQTLAFEPNPQLYQIINKSINLNKDDLKIDVIKKGVGKQLSRASFQQDIVHNLGAQRLNIRDKEGDIEIIPLDSIRLDKPVSLLKIDVEGMELDVLQGGRNLILRDRPWIYAEAATRPEFEKINSFLAEAGYTYGKTFNATPTHLFNPA